MKHAGDTGLLNLIDLKTPRIPAIVENLFGESFQLHEAHLLEDVHESRPEIVSYCYRYHYIIEAVIVLLFLAGIVCGIRYRFFLMLLSWMGFDVFLNIILGFGINEVYIMAANWLFIVPLSVAYLLKRLPVHYAYGLRVLLVCLAVYLWIYNGGLLVGYMIR